MHSKLNNPHNSLPFWPARAEKILGGLWNIGLLCVCNEHVKHAFDECQLREERIHRYTKLSNEESIFLSYPPKKVCVMLRGAEC